MNYGCSYHHNNLQPGTITSLVWMIPWLDYSYSNTGNASEYNVVKTLKKMKCTTTLITINHATLTKANKVMRLNAWNGPVRFSYRKKWPS